VLLLLLLSLTVLALELVDLGAFADGGIGAEVGVLVERVRAVMTMMAELLELLLLLLLAVSWMVSAGGRCEGEELEDGDSSE